MRKLIQCIRTIHCSTNLSNPAPQSRPIANITITWKSFISETLTQHLVEKERKLFQKYGNIRPRYDIHNVQDLENNGQSPKLISNTLRPSRTLAGYDV
jgi:hypothetical protein